MLCAIGLRDPLRVFEKKCLDEKVLYKAVPRWCAEWIGMGGKLKAGKRPTEVFAVAQAGGVMSTWTQMGAMGPL